jgi:hypothetical protein
MRTILTTEMLPITPSGRLSVILVRCVPLVPLSSLPRLVLKTLAPHTNISHNAQLLLCHVLLLMV